MSKEQQSSFAANGLAKKEEKKPYISVNKLAEYMTADAIRRRQIIKHLKKDMDFFKVYYSEVRKAIPKYFKSDYNEEIINDVIEKIKGKTEISDWDKNDNSNSIIALENIMESNLPDIENYSVVKDQFNVKNIVLGGVTISIKPDIYLQNNSNGKIGGMKSHIAKTPDNQLEKKNRVYAATLIKYSLLEHGLEPKNIDDKACISYDVFKKDYSTASKSFKRTVKSIEAACEEIALRWDSI
ncbi:conserved protein of unknown function [Tenacibaculum sp. 190524A02b]|uniref:hypothetical protein n=1 Tax=Tenacibaculum vairaonense TaxID=3137860 RepID=UPI0032B302E2